MKLTDIIHPFYFLISLFIGFFIVYSTSPPPEIIIKYPTPDNVNDIIYKDSNDVCYKYKANEVECPSNKSLIEETSIQHKNGGGKSFLARFFKK